MNRYFLMLLGALLLTTGIQAQTKGEATVAQLVKDLNRAIVQRDSAALADITRDELTFGHSGGVIQDKAAFIRAVLDGPTFFKSIDPENQTFRLRVNMLL